MKNEIVDLITITNSQDADGFEIQTETTTSGVFAELKSVNRSEFYQAQHAGVEVSLVAVIGIDDYSPDVAKVVHEGRTYKVLRTYKTAKLDVELTLNEVR